MEIGFIAKIWLFLLLSCCSYGYLSQLVTCPSMCRCHPEGEIVCRHRWLEGPLNPFFFRVIKNASDQVEIHMDHNKISGIPGRVFSMFSHLRTLNLNNNKIRSLDPEAFNGLHSLRFLDMRNNSISELPKTVFEPLRSLMSLDLRENSISRIQLQTLSPLLSLEEMALGDNPLVCDCQTQQILAWVTSRNVSEGETPITCIRQMVFTKIAWTYLAALCPMPFNYSINPMVTSTTPNPATSSGKSEVSFELSENTTLSANNFLYTLTPVSVIYNASTSPREESKTNSTPLSIHNASTTPNEESKTNVTTRAMNSKVAETHEIVTFVVVTTVLIILSVLIFVMYRRKQKRTRFKLRQDENARSVPPPGRGQELLCEDAEDEEEGYEYVDLGKDSDTARYVNLSQGNDISKK